MLVVSLTETDYDYKTNRTEDGNRVKRGKSEAAGAAVAVRQRLFSSYYCSHCHSMSSLPTTQIMQIFSLSLPVCIDRKANVNVLILTTATTLNINSDDNFNFACRSWE